MLQTLLLTSVLSTPAQAGDDPVEAVPQQARAAWTEMSRVQRLEARFEQTRASSLLSQPLVSTGTLRFERPDKMAWLVEAPGRSTMVLNGSTMAMAYPDLGVYEQVELSGDPDVERLVRSMMVWLAGDLEQVSRDYAISWVSGDPNQAVLVPHDPVVRGLLGQLTLSISGSPLRVVAVDIKEPDGDTVHIALSDVRIDPTLPSDAFSTGAP